MLNGQRKIILNGITKKVYQRSGEAVNYKFNEDKILNEVKAYIGNTYDQHYSNGKYQATDMILDAGHGEGFTMGNIMKYSMRYGKKNGKNKQDLLKIVHYAIIALYLQDKDND
jgi:hypothetical protein